MATPRPTTKRARPPFRRRTGRHRPAPPSPGGGRLRGGRRGRRSRDVLHLIKLAVGPKDVAAMERGQAARARSDEGLRHVTRMTPKRAPEILEGGSLYWVVAGVLRVRQRVLAIEAVRRADGTAATALVLQPGLVPVQPRPVKPFQGWRYLEAAAAPPDLGDGVAPVEGLEELPPGMRRALMDLGLL